jgi:hypothetical protein
MVHTDFNLLIVPITGGASQFHKNTLIIYLFISGFYAALFCLWHVVLACPESRTVVPKFRRKKI